MYVVCRGVSYMYIVCVLMFNFVLLSSHIGYGVSRGSVKWFSEMVQ